jgi:hypothetical protein
MSDDNPTGSPIPVRLLLLPHIYERLWTAAALQGDSRQDTVNRAIAFYDEVHRLEAPQWRGRFIQRRILHTIVWTDGDGHRRRIARID